MKLFDACIKAAMDYANAHRQPYIEVAEIAGYKDSDSYYLTLDPPLKVKVTDTPADDIVHRNDNFLDPYWNVEPIEHRPELEGLRSFWVYGPSYEID